MYNDGNEIITKKRMNRKLLIWIVSWLTVIGLHAETIRVMRFVPIDGAESEVAVNSLQKVVFTRDSVVLISALDGEAEPVYKYDYRSIRFDESSLPSEVQAAGEEQPMRGEKFIRDGHLLIRLDNRVYTIWGMRVRE